MLNRKLTPPNPWTARLWTRKFKTGSSTCGCFSIHSLNSPSNNIDVYLTAMCVDTGIFNIASKTLGTTSFSVLKIEQFYFNAHKPMNFNVQCLNKRDSRFFCGC